jgi:hypothetical protein
MEKTKHYYFIMNKKYIFFNIHEMVTILYEMCAPLIIFYVNLNVVH